MGEPGFRHEALIYGDSDEFLAATIPFLHNAIEAGEPALVAVSRANTRLLEGALGGDAGAVRFADMEALGRNPARIIPFWRALVEEFGDSPMRGIGEPVWPGRDAAEIDECERHESLLNVAFSSSPALSLLCPYDGRALRDDVLERVNRSHREVARGGATEPSAEYVAERDCFAGSLNAHPTDAECFEFSRGTLAEVRRRVERAARDAGFSQGDLADLVVAASELAANSIAHGGGSGLLRTWLEDGRLVIEFQDAGTIEEPLVGRLHPEPTQEGGRGLWLANQLCDLVQIRSGAGGTQIRLRPHRAR